MKEIAIRENHLYQKVFRRGKRAGGRLVSVCVLRDLSANRLRRANPRKSTASGCRFPSGKAAPSGVTVSSASSGRGFGRSRASVRSEPAFSSSSPPAPVSRSGKAPRLPPSCDTCSASWICSARSRMHLRTARTAASHETRLHGADPFLSARAVCTQALPYLPLYPYLLRIRLRGV